MSTEPEVVHDVMPVQVTETIAPAATVIADAALPEVSTEDLAKPAQKISEVIVWNQFGNQVSVGLAVLNKEQLHIAIYQSAQLPANLRPEMAPNLTQVKSGDGMLFKL